MQCIPGIDTYFWFLLCSKRLLCACAMPWLGCLPPRDAGSLVEPFGRCCIPAWRLCDPSGLDSGPLGKTLACTARESEMGAHRLAVTERRAGPQATPCGRALPALRGHRECRLIRSSWSPWEWALLGPVPSMGFMMPSSQDCPLSPLDGPGLILLGAQAVTGESPMLTEGMVSLQSGRELPWEGECASFICLC